MARTLVLLMTLGLLLNACASTNQQTSQDNFGALCRAIDTNQDGSIQRDELLAAAKNKEDAAAMFDMCDVERKGSITYDQAYRNRMLQQVIRLTTPGVR
jgi:Ca2+-binding EF-hand superfamily protein